MGSIKSTVNPTPPEAAATIQRWYHRHYHDPENYYKDKWIIISALRKTSASLSHQRRHQGLQDRLDHINSYLDRRFDATILTKREDDIRTQVYRKDRVLFDVEFNTTVSTKPRKHNDHHPVLTIDVFRDPPVMVNGLIRRDQIDTG